MADYSDEVDKEEHIATIWKNNGIEAMILLVSKFLYPFKDAILDR